MAPDAAATASVRTLGNVTLAREDARAVVVWPWLESVGQDLRIGMRWLLQRPAFTAGTARIPDRSNDRAADRIG
jgi:hypothetical protein